MKKVLLFYLILLSFTIAACGSDRHDTEIPDKEDNTPSAPNGNDENNDNDMKSDTIKLTVGSHVFTATLVDNSSTKALKELLAKGDVTIAMSDYANMEKVGPLGTSLPRNDENITTGPGDLILYQGNLFVIYYAPNSYSFTRLGKINNVTRDDLIAALGSGDVSVTLSLSLPK